MPLVYTFLLFTAFAVLHSSCQSPTPTIAEDEAPSEDSLEANWTIRDTVRLEQGTIPEGWHRQPLEKGFYIAFPEKPKERDSEERKQLIYKLEKSSYTLLLTQTDLTGDSSLALYRHRPEDFYEAIFKDMASELEVVIDHQYSFLLLQTYVSARAQFHSETERFSAQCVLVGNTLFTMSSIIWKKETTALLQIRDYFFASFGKELHIE